MNSLRPRCSRNEPKLIIVDWMSNHFLPSKSHSKSLNQIVNKSHAAIGVGFVDPNGNRIFSFGNMSKAHNVPVNGNTLFDIGSITKTFTTLLLADMVEQGIVNLTDPIEKYLPINMTCEVETT